MGRKLTKKGAHLKAWKALSKYVRIKANGVCYTCGDKRDWKEQQGGHYIHSGRSKPVTHYLEDNVKCQCVRCNKYLSGNLGRYGEKLAVEIGLDRLDEMRQLKRQPKQWTIEKLLEIEKNFNDKINELERSSQE